jgi:hypothetical protein
MRTLANAHPFHSSETGSVTSNAYAGKAERWRERGWRVGRVGRVHFYTSGGNFDRGTTSVGARVRGSSPVRRMPAYSPHTVR